MQRDGRRGFPVGSRFFGQFLIELGEIDAGGLCDALVLMKRENRNLGDLAREQGLLGAADARRVHAEQRRCDRPWGELAVELGVLTRPQLDRLLKRQAATRLRIGEALVRLGHLSPVRLGVLLDAFKAEQAPYAASGPLAGALTGSRLANRVLDLLPRFCLRVADLHVKIDPGRPLTHLPPLRHWVRTATRGPSGLQIALGAQRELAAPLAAAMLDREPKTLDERKIVEGLGAFLAALAGNAACELEKQGMSSQLEPCVASQPPSEGSHFPLAAPDAGGALVLSQG